MLDVSLSVNGRDYMGWTGITAKRSIETISGTFALDTTGEWPEDLGVYSALRPSDNCVVKMEGETVFTGRIDDVMPSYSKDEHAISIAGRDATGDLVDCSAVHKPAQWHGLKLEEIATILLKPFKLKVKVLTDTGSAFAKFAIEQGETVFEAIERMCRMRAVLPTGDVYGNLVLTRAGTSRADVDLELGKNILAGSGQFTHRDRYSLYIVKGQQPGSDYMTPEAIAEPVGKATDQALGRYRPKIILAEDVVNAAQAVDRASWDASVNAARSAKCTYTVQGWREKEGGKIWMPNRLVRVKDVWFDINMEMLISAVTYSKNDQGTLSQLECVPLGAFELLPEIEKTDVTGWLQ